jgi:hypothetical protein
MRMLLAAVLTACGWVVAPAWPGSAAPGDCPPFCDTIPDSAWITPTQIPLDDVYRWPGLAGVAVTDTAPRFAFEDFCRTAPVSGDPRDYAVAERATVRQPDGQWQLQVQVVHWRGDVWRGGQTADAAVQVAAAELRACQLTAPQTSPSLTIDEPGRLAAVVSDGGRRILRQYLVSDPRNSTVVALAMWSTSPPQVPWPSTPDEQVLDAMAAPLCTAYTGSCRR